MKLEDLGINPETGRHDLNLTTAENRFLGLLWTDHVGAAYKISAPELAVRFYCALHDIDDVPADVVTERIRQMETSRPGRRQLDQLKREVRCVQNHLVMQHRNIPVLSKAGAGGGYWIAETREEAEAFYTAFRARGLTGLVKAARGKESALVDMVQQLTFEFEELTDRTGGAAAHGARHAAEGGVPLAIEVVDSFLSKMLENPEKFSDGLRAIGQKYGSVLLPKGTVERVKTEAARLQALIAEL